MREKYIMHHCLVYISCPDTEDAMTRKWEKTLGVADRWLWGGGATREGIGWPKGKGNRIRGLWKPDIVKLKLSDWRRSESIRNNLACVTSASKTFSSNMMSFQIKWDRLVLPHLSLLRRKNKLE